MMMAAKIEPRASLIERLCELPRVGVVVRAVHRGASGFVGGFVASTCVEAWRGRPFALDDALLFGIFGAWVFLCMPLVERLTKRYGWFTDKARAQELRGRREGLREQWRNLEKFGKELEQRRSNSGD